MVALGPTLYSNIFQIFKSVGHMCLATGKRGDFTLTKKIEKWTYIFNFQTSPQFDKRTLCKVYI